MFCLKTSISELAAVGPHSNLEAGFAPCVSDLDDCIVFRAKICFQEGETVAALNIEL
jgi:hypothetical protein